VKYLSNGQEVEVVQKLDDGTFLVHMLYEQYYGENSEMVESEYATVVDHVFDEPPKELVEESIQKLVEERIKIQVEISKLHKEKNTLSYDIQRAETANAERFEGLKKYKGLELIEDFIEGRLTHILVCGYGYDYKIVEFDEFMKSDDDYDKDLKLITLYGRPKDGMSFGINKYCDGSGNDYKAWCFTSFRDAEVKLIEIVFSRIGKEAHKPNMDVVKLAKEYEFVLPDDYVSKAKSAVRKRQEEDVAEARKNLEKFELVVRRELEKENA